MTNSAIQKLREAQRRTGSCLCAGLEPCPEYLFAGMTVDMTGYKACLRAIISATRDIACAYKLNLAFFEALGQGGIELLYQVREHVPDDVLLIADAKRGDIGTSSERYALALYDHLGVDAATVNPLMGGDSVEPFLAYGEKLTYLLALTSNPGAADFLVASDLYLRIAEKAAGWNTRGNVGLVVGATQGDRVRAVREAAPDLPFLVPGIGAQGGRLEALAQHGRAAGAADETPFEGLLVHVTRGLLPGSEDTGDPRDAVRQKALFYRDRIAEVFRGGTDDRAG